MIVRARLVGNDVLLGQDRHPHLAAHPINDGRPHVGGLDRWLDIPALDHQHPLAKVARPGVRVVHHVLAGHWRGLPNVRHGGAVPPLQVAVAVGRHGRRAQCGFLFWEVGNGHVEVDHAEPEYVAPVRCVAALTERVVKHVAPRLGAHVERLIIRILRDSEFQPADSCLENVVRHIGALELCPIHIVQVFQQLGLGLRVILCRL